MDALKAAIAAKRTSQQAEFGTRKFVKRSELEEQRTRNRAKASEEHKRASTVQPYGDEQRASKKLKSEKKSAQATLDTDAVEASLSLTEVFRRLRALDQPVTLFGEDDAARRLRLRAAAASLATEDDQRGGQQANELLALLRASKKLPSGTESSKGSRGEKPTATDTDGDRATPSDGGAQRQGGDREPSDEAADLAIAFRAAADAVKAKQAAAAMSTEDRISHHLKIWCAAWKRDLEQRPEAVRESGEGARASTLQTQTMQYFKPLYRDLRNRALPPDMLAGLWLIVEAIENRNYLRAYDIYMRLAVGNCPWPIGVTSVGIHERSSREKISHVTGMNAGGAAHIMNDEATRKYLQAIKRLLTFMQRCFPTDPSRSVDFDGHRDAAYGFAGAGSDKLALLEAEHAGTTWRDEGLQQAPHFMDSDGSVKVPQRWDDMVRYTVRRMEGSTGLGGAASPPPMNRGSPALMPPANGETTTPSMAGSNVMVHNTTPEPIKLNK